MSDEKAGYADDAGIDAGLDELPSADTIKETVENLEANGFDVVVVESATAALETIQSHIPAEASVMNGHSTTLEEIGFDECLSDGDHEWESLPDKIWSIDDDAERQAARRDSQTVDYFLGSVNGISQTGELVAAVALAVGSVPIPSPPVTS